MQYDNKRHYLVINESYCLIQPIFISFRSFSNWTPNWWMLVAFEWSWQALMGIEKVTLKNTCRLWFVRCCYTQYWLENGGLMLYYSSSANVNAIGYPTKYQLRQNRTNVVAISYGPWWPWNIDDDRCHFYRDIQHTDFQTISSCHMNNWWPTSTAAFVSSWILRDPTISSSTGLCERNPSVWIPLTGNQCDGRCSHVMTPSLSYKNYWWYWWW